MILIFFCKRHRKTKAFGVQREKVTKRFYAHHPQVTMFDLATTPPTLIRRDYALAYLRMAGGKLPECYIDEIGNLRNSKDELVMQGPNAFGT